MLGSLRDLADPVIRLARRSQHDVLDTATHEVLEAADLHRRRLQRLIRQWEEFSVTFNTERRWLDQICARQRQASRTDSNAAIIELKECQLLMNDEKSIMSQVKRMRLFKKFLLM
jgi:hypothetical protein